MANKYSKQLFNMSFAGNLHTSKGCSSALARSLPWAQAVHLALQNQQILAAELFLKTIPYTFTRSIKICFYTDFFFFLDEGTLAKWKWHYWQPVTFLLIDRATYTLTCLKPGQVDTIEVSIILSFKLHVSGTRRVKTTTQINEEWWKKLLVPEWEDSNA